MAERDPRIERLWSQGLWAVGARRFAPGAPSSEELVARLRSLSQPEGPFVSLLDARAVGGERHLLSAWAHLGRSRGRGRARLRDRGAEFLLYLAGDDQLPRALRKVGVGPDTTEFVVVGEAPRTSSEVLPSLGLVEAPELFPRPPSAETMERLGLSVEGVPAGEWEGLLLEAVAVVDLVPPAARTAEGTAAPMAHRRPSGGSGGGGRPAETT